MKAFASGLICALMAGFLIGCGGAPEGAGHVNDPTPAGQKPEGYVETPTTEEEQEKAKEQYKDYAEQQRRAAGQR